MEYHSLGQPTLHVLRTLTLASSWAKSSNTMKTLHGIGCVHLWPGWLGLQLAAQHHERTSYCILTAREKIRTQNFKYVFNRMCTAFTPLQSRKIMNWTIINWDCLYSHFLTSKPTSNPTHSCGISPRSDISQMRMFSYWGPGSPEFPTAWAVSFPFCQPKQLWPYFMYLL